MNKECEFARGGGYCLCSACQSMVKTLQEMEKVDTNAEVKKMESEMQEMVEKLNKERGLNGEDS